MCLAIWKPKGVEIAKRYLKNGYDENDDGCGFALSTGHRIECYKGFKTFGEFWAAIKPLQKRYPMVIHFRWATHGDRKSTDNMHPFLMDSNRYAAVHNGVLNIKTEGDKSDTRIFCELVLEPMLKRVGIKDNALRFLVESTIGSGNKIVVMRADGKAVIYNESAGHWYKGAWFSNHGYQYTTRWETPTGHSGKNYTGYSKGFTSSSGYPWRSLANANKQTEMVYPKNETVFDSDEIEAEAQAQAEAIARHSLGIPDAESSNTVNLDYDRSNHQIITEQ